MKVMTIVFCLVLALPTLALADKPSETPASHCNTPSAINGPSLLAGPVWQTIGGSTVGTFDWTYDFCTVAGATYTFSFCQMGGTADYDTGLSIWDLGMVQQACNDDFCGLLSEVTWTAPANGTYLIRVGGFGNQEGNFTLAYTADQTCEPISVDPSTWGRVKASYR